MRKENHSLTKRYYHFALGKSERPTIVSIKEEKLGEALKRVRPELLNHIFTMTVYSRTHVSMRADNMYVGEVHDVEPLKNRHPEQFQQMYNRAVERVFGQEERLTDQYCQCANGGLVLLKDNEKVYDNSWQCVWPHHEKGQLLYDQNIDIDEDVHFQVNGIPERLYEFIIRQSDTETLRMECFFHNSHKVINPESDYKDTAIIRYIQGVFDNETKLFRTRTKTDKFLALGKRVTTLNGIKEENESVYKDLIIALEQNKQEIMANGTLLIVEGYNGIYSFLPKDTGVMDNSFNVIFPESEVKNDKRFKVHHFLSLKKANATDITARNDVFWASHPYYSRHLINS